MPEAMGSDTGDSERMNKDRLSPAISCEANRRPPGAESIPPLSPDWGETKRLRPHCPRFRKNGNLLQLHPTAMAGPKLDLRRLTKTFGLESDQTGGGGGGTLLDMNLCEPSQKIVPERSISNQDRVILEVSTSIESKLESPRSELTAWNKGASEMRGGPAEFPELQRLHH